MPKVYEIKFFKKENELFIALYDEPSLFLPEFWIDNIKAKQLGFTDLPASIRLERKYKIKELGLEPFEFNKEGLLFGLSDFFNRVTREFNKKNQTNITNNQFINMINEKRDIEVKQGNYNENIQGDYYEQSGNIGIGHVSGGEIKEGAKVAGVINEAQKQNLADAAQEIQQLLEQLSETYPTTTSKEKNIVVGEVVDCIESNPSLKAKVINALRAGGTEAFKEAINHPLVNILVASIEGWQDTE